jgi:hypothetical protein
MFITQATDLAAVKSVTKKKDFIATTAERISILWVRQ